MLARTLPRLGAPALAARRFASTKSPSLPLRPAPNSQAAGTDATASPKVKVRRIVLTGAVALITIVGAMTGATLKIDKDVVKQRKEVLELPLDERIEMLESRRAGLVALKMPLERKLVGLRERMADERDAEARKETGKA